MVVYLRGSLIKLYSSQAMQVVRLLRSACSWSPYRSSVIFPMRATSAASGEGSWEPEAQTILVLNGPVENRIFWREHLGYTRGEFVGNKSPIITHQKWQASRAASCEHNEHQLRSLQKTSTAGCSRKDSHPQRLTQNGLQLLGYRRGLGLGSRRARCCGLALANLRTDAPIVSNSPTAYEACEEGHAVRRVKDRFLKEC